MGTTAAPSPAASRTRIPVACGVDIGSTNVKVLAIDADGSVVGRVSRATPRDPADLSINGLALFETVENMLQELCSDHLLICAASVVGVGEDGFLVDRRIQPLNPALAWFDPRRRGIFEELAGRLDPEILDVRLDPARTLVGWAWAASQAPDAQAHRWLSIADFILARWTRRPFISDTLASRTAAWTADSRTWAADRVLATLGDIAVVPEVLAVGTVVGPLSSERLRNSGILASDAVAVAGGHDHPIGGWVVDRVQSGAVLDSMGTAEVVVAQSHQAVTVRPDEVDIAPGILSNGSTLLRVEELARNVAWASQNPQVSRAIRDIISGDASPTADLDEDMFRPGSQGGGQPAYLKGAPSSPLGRASSVLGALARNGRNAVDAVREHMPADARVRMAGGWGRSAGWVEIKSRINGYESLPIHEPEVTAVGAALLAALARGWDPDPARVLGE